MFWGKISAKFGQIWTKVIKIWAYLIRFGQNQNLVSPKHEISYGKERALIKGIPFETRVGAPKA